ncbi:MAG: energy-coupling factor transporter transmembrane protein EcfT [bacterium]|nr:energy-coupling factor transporter transmembrane protein EcfT [bacterium]
MSGVAPWRIVGVRLWLTLAAALLLTQVAFVRQGEPLVGPVTDLGLIAGLRASGRLLTVILASALFVTTTEPVSLVCALMAVGLPYRWGFALVTALRLAPIFRLEAQQVYRAQLARGVAYDAAGPRRWRLMLQHLCTPLLVSALRTAHVLSLSMEGRAFGLHRRRSYMREVAAGGRDVVAVALLAASVFLGAWHTIDGGGEMWSTSGEYELGPTIGQLDASREVLTGGSFELTGGLWPGMFIVSLTRDSDGDGDVDLDDFAAFDTCLAGPDAGLGTGCDCFDADADGDNDLLDFAEFQVSFTGS